MDTTLAGYKWPVPETEPTGQRRHGLSPLGDQVWAALDQQGLDLWRYWITGRSAGTRSGRQILPGC